MDSAWALPTELKIGDEMYSIRTDYRAILDILRAQSDEELTDQEKTQVLFEILFLDPQNIPRKNLEEACKKAVEFIDCGIKDDGRKKPRLMDWEQDAAIIAPAVSNVVGKDIRSVDYMHWWSFMGAYMEIGEGLYSQIIGIRQKKAKGKRLEKWEQEFYQANRSLIELKTKRQRQERPDDEKEELRKLFGYK